MNRVRYFRKRTPFKIKLLIAGTSLLLSFCLLELTLRHVGPEINRSEKIFRKENMVPEPKILCVGDSFTHGGMTARNETYPYYLEQMINDSPPGHHLIAQTWPRYRVINAGVCAMNTREMWEYLPRWVETFRPVALVLLIGSANWFSFLDYDLYRRDDWQSQLKRHFFALRVFRAIRFIYLQLMGADLATDRDPPKRLRLKIDDETQLQPSLWELYGRSLDSQSMMREPATGQHAVGDSSGRIEEGARGQAVTASVLESGRSTSEVDAALLNVHGLFQSGSLEALHDELMAVERTYGPSERVAQAVAYYRREIADAYRRNRRNVEATAWYLKAIEADPYDPYNYSWLSVMHLVQSRYSAVDILEGLSRIRERDPKVTVTSSFRMCEEAFMRRERDQVDLERHTYADLERVVELCRRYNVRLVLLNYPVSYPMINKVLRSLAEAYSLPFVDNLAVFSRLAPIETYVLDDEHCTAEGHKIIAQNVYRVLLDKGLLHQ